MIRLVQFLKIYISQGSVVTRFDTVLQIVHRVYQ